MKMMKNIMALALAFTFVFVGANDASAMPGYGDEDVASMPVPSNPEHSSCENCHTDSNQKDDVYGFDEGEMCATCHVNPENSHGYSGNGEAEKPATAHSSHGVYKDDNGFMGYDDCRGCHINPAIDDDPNNDGPYVPTADTDDDITTPRVSYITPHLEDPNDATTTMFAAEDCGTCHEGATIAATPANDADNDGITQSWETKFGTSDTVVNDPDADFDGDGATDLEEINFSGKETSFSDPTVKDTDGDGFDDKYEIDNYQNTNDGFMLSDGWLDPEVADVIDPANDTPITVTLEEGVATGTLPTGYDSTIPAYVLVDGTVGTVEITDTTTGAWTYTLTARTFEDVDTFTIAYYNGTTLASQTVTVSQVVATEDIPVDAPALSEDGTVTGDLGDDYTGGSKTLPGTYGTLTVTAEGVYTYSLNTDAVVPAGGYTETFTISYTDADGTVVTYTITIDVPATLVETPVDTDGDTIADDLDTDDDNDGFSDADENAAGTDPLDATDHPAPFGPGGGSGNGSGGGSGESNPETGSGSLMVAFGAITAASAGLVATRRRK